MDINKNLVQFHDIISYYVMEKFDLKWLHIETNQGINTILRTVRKSAEKACKNTFIYDLHMIVTKSLYIHSFNT